MDRFYVGVDAKYRHKLPPSLLGDSWSGKCGICALPLMAYKPTLDRWRDLALRSGHTVRIVCPGCAHQHLEGQEYVEIHDLNPEIGKHFREG